MDLTRQFETQDNVKIHANTAARELLADFKDERLDLWVSGYVRGETVTGEARILHKARPKTRIVLSEPELSPLLGRGIAQQRGEHHSPIASLPAFSPHPIQDWTP